MVRLLVLFFSYQILHFNSSILILEMIYNFSFKQSNGDGVKNYQQQTVKCRSKLIERRGIYVQTHGRPS